MGLSSGFMSGLHGIATWFMRIAGINIIWFVMNLPIVVVVMSALQRDDISGIILYSLPALLFFPFLFFPSTIALFATVRDWIMRREQPELVKAYLTYFKENYKQSLISGLIWGVVWLILFVDILYFQGKSDFFLMAFIIAGICLVIMNINYFSVFSHYHMSVKEYFKNAFFVSIGRPFLSILVLIIHYLLFMLTLEIWFIIPFFFGTLSALASFSLFYRFALKVQEKIGNSNS